jgi:restriction system protein
MSVAPMPIPDFQTIMLPMIQFLADGKEHPSAETISFLADSFKLTPEERSEMLASGRQARFTNRVHWARIHLSKAGLIVAPRRGVYLINQAGQTLLATKPNRVDMRLLSDRYPDYEAFRRATTLSAQAGTPVTDDAQENPEEVMDSAYESRREALALELLDRMKGASPAFFESLVVKLLVALGYGGSQAMPLGRNQFVPQVRGCLSLAFCVPSRQQPHQVALAQAAEPGPRSPCS